MRGSTISRRVLLLFGVVACFGHLVFAGTLYTIGPDSTMSWPTGFYSVSTGGTATWQFDLGDGSLGFNGGLAFNPFNNLFYAIANDSGGNSSLVSFSPWGGGAFTPIGGLGQGFVSGLAYSTSDGYLYGISTDWLGNSSLSRISLGGAVTPLGSLGSGFIGGRGLTFRPADGLLYGVSAGALGTPCLFQSIDPVALPPTQLFDFCSGSAWFDGGVAWSWADGLFYVISNDWSGSTLQTLTPAGTLTPVGVIGGGFWNVGLVDATPIPEPSLWLPLAAALMAGVWVRFRRRA